MTTTELREPRQIEDAAIEYVIERELAEGRQARRDEAADGVVRGDRIIAVKACGTTSCGAELLLECSQYVAARDDPERSWLYLVENVAQGDPALFRLIRVGGERLQELVEFARERRYWTVPVPVRVYDDELRMV
ncbi:MULTISPECIES: hypothetical protein [unclassified Blastococcus]